MKSEERKIDLVKALILSYPLLGESGFKLNKPIALICEDEKKQQILWRKLCLFPKEQKLIPLTVKPKELEKNWVNAEYGVFLLIIDKGDILSKIWSGYWKLLKWWELILEVKN